MKPVRAIAAGVTSASALMLALLALLAGCGGPPANPGGAPPTSSSPSVATPTLTVTPTQVVSSRLAYPWHWPNDLATPGRVTHSYAVPPVPELVSISAGNHPAAAGQRPFNRMSFTFATAFPSYRFEWADRLVSDGSGKVIPLRGTDVLRIVFTQAEAHTADGTRSTIISQPARPIGYRSMTDFAQAGDFEGVLTYGIGSTRPVFKSNPRTSVRAYELEAVTATGQHRYVIAIDIDASA
jgi:hypothetical protein